MMYLKSMSKIVFILLIGMSVFTSCKKDKLETLTPTTKPSIETEAQSNYFNQRNGNQKNGTDSVDCLAFNYPLNVILPGGTTLSVNSEEELYTVIDDWFEENEGENPTELEDFPTLDFPITVSLEDGSTQTVNDEEELCELYSDCYDDFDEEWEGEEWEDEDCFTIEFPITITLPDGTTQTINNEEELYGFDGDIDIEDIEDLDSIVCPQIVFPITIVLEDGTSQVINSEEELEQAYIECFGDDFEFEDEEWEGEEWEMDCFTLNFPVTVVLPDGTTALANDEMELDEAIITWYMQNVESEEEPTFQYPITVTLEDGTTQTVNDDEGFETLIEGC